MRKHTQTPNEGNSRKHLTSFFKQLLRKNGRKEEWRKGGREEGKRKKLSHIKGNQGDTVIKSNMEIWLGSQERKKDTGGNHTKSE